MQMERISSQQSNEKIMQSPHFFFCCGDNIEFVERMKAMAGNWLLGMAPLEHPGFTLLVSKDFSDYCSSFSEQFVCAFTGWVRSLALPPVNYKSPSSFQPHISQTAKEIIKHWPVADSNITGSFSGVIFSKHDRQLMIFADPGSIYPIYYARIPDGWVGGTHLMLLARILESDIDLTGVVERLSPPGFINYGSRTIFKNVKRILPGELITWSQEKEVSVKSYDQTFYGTEFKLDTHELAEMVWNDYKNDIHSCAGENTRINLGLSGGWDSRLIAAALTNSQVRCFTYAVEKDEYEVEIAEKVSRLMGAEFVFTNFSSEWAPSRERFLQNLLSTEATYIPEWLAILDRFASHTFEPFLLGDMFEAVAGRYLYRLTSRPGRKRVYIDRAIGRVDLPLQKKGDFETWRDRRIGSVQRATIFAMESLADFIDCGLTSQILGEVENDLDEIFFRISSHDITYTDTFDELFAWYLKCNMAVGKQILTLNEKFFGLNPTMSFRTLRQVSKIHPFKRASGQLMHHIQQLPDISAYSKIPNANAPFIPSSSPLWLSDLVWAARSTADQWMIRQAMRSQNKYARMRVLKTFNMVHLYNLPEAMSNVASWFSGNYIKPDRYLGAFLSRAQMENWPLCIYDITGPASLSILLDLAN